MKNDKRNYIVVGSFVIAMVTALTVWITLLSDRTGPTDTYYVVYENVAQLKSGGQLQYEGYAVGFIHTIEPQQRDGELVFRVTVHVKRDWPIPVDSQAAIVTGIFEAAVIDIAGGSKSELLVPGSEISSRESGDLFALANEAAAKIGGILDDIAERAPVMLENVETVSTDLRLAMEQINDLLDRENVGRIDRILTNVEGATGDLNQLLDALRDAGENVNELVKNLDRLLDEEDGDLSEAIDDVRHTTAALASHIDAITANLEDATRNANEFSKQIRENPGVLLRGRETGE
ncbi:MAG: MCE family protein [Deltaproteobacteria bacterium]|nr:MCE family protein [Deltaproteobacteria bacterium]MBW2362012.1 MCE family protein [Deltaproteobacteria bacterium]